MKKFTVKATAVAMMSVCGSAAFAGSISSPATDAAAVVYATEGVANSTPLRSPSVVYTMGVGRSTSQGFTLIYTPSAGVTFGASGCSVVPTTNSAATVVVTVKRQSAAECAYDVAISAGNVIAGDVFNWTPPANNIATHTMAGSGNTIGITLNIYDTGETARVDNSGPLTRIVARSANAVSITATQDTATVANVNDSRGPLFGFVANGTAPADTANIAAANFVINNNPNSYVAADGATVWNAANASFGNNIAVNIAGTNFGGLAANNPITVLTNVAGAGNAPTVTVANGFATFSLVPTALANAPGATTVTVSATTAGTSSLGTSRTFGVSAVGNYVVNTTPQAILGNTSWWVWSANAIQLQSAFVNLNPPPGTINRFFFQNLGVANAQYSAQCYYEGTVTGTTKAIGTGSYTGSLIAGTTAVEATDVCGVTAGTTRASIVFTINAPAANIKAVYMNAIPGNATGFIPLERPYAGSTY